MRKRGKTGINEVGMYGRKEGRKEGRDDKGGKRHRNGDN